MTEYVRHPNTWEELAVTTNTTTSEIRTFFGTTYGTNKYYLNFVGVDSPGQFVVLFDISTQIGSEPYNPHRQSIIYASDGTYLRAERRPDGKTVSFDGSSDPLSSDVSFEVA